MQTVVSSRICLGAGAMAQLVERLPLQTQSPGFNSQHSIKQVWWHTHGVPAFGRQRQEDQNFEAILSYLQSQFEASLGYMRHSMEKKRQC